MFELFENETKEMKSFCKENNLIWFHSGGGFYHYQLNDEVSKWLINLYDHEESFDIPTKSSDLCRGGLWLETVLEEYWISIDKEEYFYNPHQHDESIYDICSLLEDYISGLKIDNVYTQSGNIAIEKIKLIDMIPIMEKVNQEIKKFLDKENK